MSHPDLLNIIRTYLLSIEGITSLATSGIHIQTFPESIRVPSPFILISRVSHDDVSVFQTETLPFGITTQIKCFGDTLDKSDDLFRTLDDNINGITSVATEENLIWYCDLVSGPQDGIDPNLPVVEGKEWHFTVSNYEWTIS